MDGELGQGMSAISSPSPSAQSDRPSPLFSSRPGLNSRVTAPKNTLQLVVFCCKTLRLGLGAAEPSDRGPAVPFLDERKQGGRGSAGTLSNVSLSRSDRVN